jgi:hypothetical protein
MSKTEIFLLIILAVILLGSIWFIFSDEIWLLLCYLESQIYPTFSVPQYFPPAKVLVLIIYATSSAGEV